MSLFRKIRRTQPMPPWMKWAVVAFLGLAFIGSMHHKGAKNAPQTIPETLHNAAKNLSPHKLLPIEAYKKDILPKNPVLPSTANIEPLQGIKDISPGTGTPAVCGQQVTIAYRTFAKDGKPIDSGQTVTFRIGNGKTIPALDEGVVGMKKGGKRLILSTDDRFQAELLDVTPPIPDADATPYRIAIVTPGHGAFALCGKPGTFQVTLWNADGSKLFSTDKAKPITFAPGQSEVFLGLEQGVIGMRRGEMRTLIIPPAFQKTMDGNPPKINFPLPKDQTVLVDVEAVP